MRTHLELSKKLSLYRKDGLVLFLFELGVFHICNLVSAFLNNHSFLILLLINSLNVLQRSFKIESILSFLIYILLEIILVASVVIAIEFFFLHIIKRSIISMYKCIYIHIIRINMRLLSNYFRLTDHVILQLIIQAIKFGWLSYLYQLWTDWEI